MDKLILGEKLEALHRCVRRVEERRAASADELRSDVDRQDIVALNLTRAVQLCVDIAAVIIADTDELVPQTMGEAFDSLLRLGIIDGELASRMKAAVGFRNIAVHNYRTIDWDIVFFISHQGLGVFRDFARATAALL